MATLLKVLNEVEQSNELLVTRINPYSIPLVTNDYANWTREIAWVIDGSFVRIIADDSPGERWSSTLHRHFTLPRAANLAKLSVGGYRVQGDLVNPGYAYQKITLIKPDLTEIILYEGDDDFGPDLLLSLEDITAYLNVAGTYELRFTGTVEVSWDFESGYIFDWSEVWFRDVALYVDSSSTTNIILPVETTTPIDTVALYKFNLDLIENTPPIESFLIEKFTPLATQAAAFLVATSTDHKIWDFRTGIPTGYVDTPEVDFGLVGIDKTLEEIHFESHGATPRSIDVFVSADGGKTWIYIGQDSIYAGKKGFVHPWLTAESFVVRFYGTALYLFSYALYARAGAPQIRQS